MFGATPPRRISRSSTRKLTESLSSCSTTRESANLPWKVIRWSVAMEPAISSDMGPRRVRGASPGECRKSVSGAGGAYRPVRVGVPGSSQYRRCMTYQRLAYDDQDSTVKMHLDCTACASEMGLAAPALSPDLLGQAPPITYDE